MLRARVLLGSLQEILSVLDFLQAEVVGMLRPEGSPDCFAYDIFCGRGAMSSEKCIPIEVSVSVNNGLIRHM